MKKFALFLVFLIVASVAFSQAKVYKGVSVLTATTKLGTNLFTGDHVYCTATGNEYILTANQGGSATITTIIASGSYTLLTSYSSTLSLATLTLTGKATLPWISGTHSNITTDSCVTLVASTLAKAPTVSVATTLNLPGTANTITKTTGNGNSATFSHSLVVTDSLTVSKVITGAAPSRGSSAFVTNGTRAAVYIAGATSSDYYIVRGIAADQYTRPVAGDLLNCFAKTDSLIVMRQAGTTSGQGFTYFRIK